MANVVYYENPFSLADPTAVLKVEGAPTVAQWLESSGYAVKLRERPVVLVLNGNELLESEFGHVLTGDDLLVLTALPEAQVIPLVVEFVTAYWAYIAVAVVLIGAALVLPGMLEPSITEGTQDDSPNHSLANRGNRARMGNPKPVLYGKARIYPDLSSQAYSEFESDSDQIVFMLYELSQGELSIDTASYRFEDTLFSSFQDGSLEIIAPGATSTLFPAEVNVSSEVANIEVEDAVIGPFAANPTATTINRIGIDVIAPGGVYHQSSSGKQSRLGVTLLFEARLINNAGAPLGSWTELGRPFLSGVDRTALRRSFSYPVSTGRYEVRLSRVGTSSTSNKDVDDITWSQLRAYYSDTLPVTNTTRVAVRIRSTDQLGNRALTKFNLVATRKLPIWNGTTWSAATATTNPAWAFADACRAAYGGKRADAFIDLAGLLALSSTFTTDGYECNGVIDTKMSLWDALTRIAQTANCMPIDRGGIYTMVQDKAVSVPVQMFNMRNIVKDSFSIDHLGVLEETADHCVLKYYDEDQDYRLVSLPCVLPSGTDDAPREVTMWGVTNRDQAYELGMRLSAVNRYRRQIVSFETGLEGRIPVYMDLIRVSHRMLGVEGVDQVSGDITAYNGTNTITVTESLTGLFTTPYVLIHDLENEPKGPYACTVLTDKTIRIDEAFDDDGLVFTAGYARPKFSIGDSSTFDARVKVTKVVPTDQHRVRIEGFIDNATVYTITSGETPPDPTPLRDLQSLTPIVSKLKAAADGTTVEADVLLTWEGTNASQWEVQYSTDNTNWFTAAYVRQPKYTDAPPVVGTRYYRVAGLSAFKGPWATLTVNVGDLLDARAPSVASSLVVNSAGAAAEIRVVVPNGSTTGAPSEVKIYRATAPSTTFASSSLIDTIPATYDQANDRYTAFLVDGSVVDNQRYYYFALPVNPNGDAADHYPTASNPGVPVDVVVVVPSLTEYLEDFSHGLLSKIDAGWTYLVSNGERSIQTGTTPNGSKYLRLGNNSGNDEVSMHRNAADAMPVKLDQLYVCRMVAARLSGASSQLIFGVAGISADKSAFVNSLGSNSAANQFFWGKNGGVEGTTSFVEYVFWFKRTGGAVSNVYYPTNSPTNPAIIHTDARFAVPIIYANYSGQAGDYAIALVELREADNYGAVTGVTLRDEVGALLTGIDVRNDQLVKQALGFLNQNASFDYPRLEGAGFTFPNVSGTYTLRPASWFSSQATTGLHTYVDVTTRDEVEVLSGKVLTGSPNPCNPKTTYDIAALIKSKTGTTSVTLYVEEYDTQALPAGALYIGGSGGEPGGVTRTRVITIATNASLGTSYTLLAGTYTPTATCKWFSLSLLSTGQTVVCEWFGYREESTKGATLGTDLKTSGGSTVGDADALNTSVIVFDHTKAVVWNSFGSTSSDYSPASSTQTITVNVRNGLGTIVATRTITFTVTYSNGQITVTEDTVDGIALTRTGNDTDNVVVTLTYNSKTSTLNAMTISTTTSGVGK